MSSAFENAFIYVFFIYLGLFFIFAIIYFSIFYYHRLIKKSDKIWAEIMANDFATVYVLIFAPPFMLFCIGYLCELLYNYVRF